MSRPAPVRARGSAEYGFTTGNPNCWVRRGGRNPEANGRGGLPLSGAPTAPGGSASVRDESQCLLCVPPRQRASVRARSPSHSNPGLPGTDVGLVYVPPLHTRHCPRHCGPTGPVGRCRPGHAPAPPAAQASASYLGLDAQPQEPGHCRRNSGRRDGRRLSVRAGRWQIPLVMRSPHSFPAAAHPCWRLYCHFGGPLLRFAADRGSGRSTHHRWVTRDGRSTDFSRPLRLCV